MPTYEYRCDSCKRRYERRESFSAAASHTCQRCRKGTATRILHAPTVVFKGSGFYVNDSKQSQASTTSGSAGSAGTKKSESKSAKSGESSAKD